MVKENVLEMKNISKDFSGVVVLENVDFSLKKGEVHALVGANGAGKSTLMKIINGIWVKYSGEVYLNGEKVKFNNPIDATKQGIGMIHQELDLTPNLTVAENIYLGREECGSAGIVMNKKKMMKEAQKLLDDLQFNVNAKEQVCDLPTAQQQLVLIARTVSMNSSLIIMDEPTSSLSISEIDNLFRVIKELQGRGISIIYISHFLEEIFKIADRVTTLRNGKLVGTREVADTTIQEVITMMVGEGHDHDKKFYRDRPSEEVRLKVQNISQASGLVHDVQFHVCKGEILGVAGVLGSGRTEIGKMIFGAMKKKAGYKILLNGKECPMRSPKEAVNYGMAYVSENRKTEGLIMKASLLSNISLVPLARQKHPWVDHANLKKIADKMGRSMSLKYSDMNQTADSLSGGNQQKVVLSKWLATDINLLILDQPTRGIDVGAKNEIYALADDLAKKGTSIIYISDELEELYNLCDRILVIKKGEVVADMENYDRHVTKAELFEKMITDKEGEVIDLL